MTIQKLNEGLEYLDMEGQVEPVFTIDEYVAKMGPDSDVVTLTFNVKSKMAADDLMTWFERGYTFVLDASTSTGEVEHGRHLVFVELERRSVIPRQVNELISDLQTLTGIAPKDWVMEVNDKTLPFDAKAIRDHVVLNPNVYRAAAKAKEKGLDTIPPSQEKALLEAIDKLIGL